MIASLDIRTCCATTYGHPFASWMLGESFHPGGLELTARLARLAGIGPETAVLDAGSGRGATAVHLAQTLGLTYICNDTIYWGPNWTESPLDQRLAEYERATQAQAWTFDGNVDGLSDKGSKIIQLT